MQKHDRGRSGEVEGGDRGGEKLPAGQSGRVEGCRGSESRDRLQLETAVEAGSEMRQVLNIFASVLLRLIFHYVPVDCTLLHSIVLKF